MSELGTNSAEEDRLAQATGRAEDDLFDANPWYEWGPYLSERAWGTVREDYSADGDAWRFVPARPCPFAGVPVERGRHGRDLGYPAGPVPGPGAVERRGSDPEGADVRADRSAGQSRGGRQGVLVVPGRRCPAMPGCGGGTTIRRPPSRTSGWSSITEVGTNPSWNCWTPASSTRTGTGRWMSPMPRRPPTEVLARITVQQPRPGGGEPVGPADPVVPQHLAGQRGGAAGPVPGRRRHRRRASTARWVPAGRCPRRRRRSRRRCSATTRPTTRASSMAPG